MNRLMKALRAKGLIALCVIAIAPTMLVAGAARAEIAGGVAAQAFARAATAQRVIYVGIPREQFNYSYAEQINTQWCWAASIQMVLGYYGVSVGQEEIVRRSYGMDPWGNLPNWPGSFQLITANLNNWGIDNRGESYVVASSMGSGAPTPAILLDELRNRRPVLIGYTSGPLSGHAVVVTAASYVETPQGPLITTLIVRDPYPSPGNRRSLGRVEYPGYALASHITAYWYIRVGRT